MRSLTVKTALPVWSNFRISPFKSDSKKKCFPLTFSATAMSRSSCIHQACVRALLTELSFNICVWTLLTFWYHGKTNSSSSVLEPTSLLSYIDWCSYEVERQVVSMKQKSCSRGVENTYQHSVPSFLTKLHFKQSKIRNNIIPTPGSKGTPQNSTKQR